MRIIRPGVYKIENTFDGKFYIGSSKDITNRWGIHLSNLRKNTHHCKYLQHAWNKYGEESFVLTILEECEALRETLIAREQHWMDTLKPEYNHNPIAGSSLGRKHTPETIATMIKTRKGRKRSAEARANISKGKLGKKYSDEHRANMSRTRIGRKQKPETIARRTESIRQTREKKTPEQRSIYANKAWVTRRERKPPRVCEVPGCLGKHAAKGLCEGHYYHVKMWQKLNPSLD